MNDNKKINVNLPGGWTKKMHLKKFICGVVGFFSPKASWHVAHKLFTKKEQEIMDIDLSFLDQK